MVERNLQPSPLVYKLRRNGRGSRTRPYLERTAKVGSYPANKLGLYDMHGNVYQWTDSLWIKGDTIRVIRGGSCIHAGVFCQAGHRSWSAPTSQAQSIGFRLARVSVQ